MHEKAKVSEAEFFLTCLQRSASSGDKFHYFLSAFLSAARSALQYALEEARTKGSQSWYESAMRTSPILRFFKDKRDINIHQRPVAVMQQTILTESVHVGISESLVIVMERADGTTETREISGSPT